MAQARTSDRSGVVASYEKLRDEAAARWQTLKSEQRCHLFVGTATCGRAAGALEVLRTLGEEVERRGLDATVTEVGCMGHCYAEPLVTISKPGYPPICYGYVTPGIASQLVEHFVLGDDLCLEWALGALEENELVPTIFDLPRFRFEKPVLLRNCGLIDPEEIDHYIALGGYGALCKALQMAPEEVIAEVERSGLRGLGGAGFPAGRKWRACHSAPGKEKYVVCNGDEGDPGAFQDRCLMESDPQAVLEGMVMAAYAVGAEQGYIYVRAEYPLAVRRLRLAVEQARGKGLLGSNILGSGFGFDIEVFEGAGAFVCGESTALVLSIEGKRGMPKPLPRPRTTEVGLWGMPTLLNNVKTFAYIPVIIGQGWASFSSVGSERSKGTAVFALAGKVVNTGLTEVPMGTTLRQVIFDVGGDIAGGKKFKAVQIGGPSGGCLPESLLDTPIDFDSLTGAGAIMGSGGMVILDEDNCMVDTAHYFLEFTRKESCGKCTMCRLGARQMLDMLEDFTQGKGRLEDIELLRELAEDIKVGSLCGLGKTAPNPVLTTLRYFYEEYEAHILEQRCPALVCEPLIAYYIIPEKCERSCDACVGSCPTEAIFTGRKMIKVIDQEKCVRCGSCLSACPPQYSAVVKFSPRGLVPEAERPPRRRKKKGS